jgi:flagellar export protein FliJ
MPNKFPYEKILKIREWDEKIQEIKLKKEIYKMNLLERELIEINNAILEFYEQINSENFLTGFNLGSYLSFLNILLKNKKVEIEEQKNIVDENMELLKEKRKEKRLVEMLEEEYEINENEKINYEERKIFDEIGILKFFNK